jgi:hypothetical protein
MNLEKKIKNLCVWKLSENEFDLKKGNHCDGYDKNCDKYCRASNISSTYKTIVRNYILNKEVENEKRK